MSGREGEGEREREGRRDGGDVCGFHLKAVVKGTSNPFRSACRPRSVRYRTLVHTIRASTMNLKLAPGHMFLFSLGEKMWNWGERERQRESGVWEPSRRVFHLRQKRQEVAGRWKNDDLDPEAFTFSCPMSYVSEGASLFPAIYRPRHVIDTSTA